MIAPLTGGLPVVTQYNMKLCNMKQKSVKQYNTQYNMKQCNM